MFQEVEMDGRDILFKILLDIGRLPFILERIVRELLYRGGQTPISHNVPIDSGGRFDIDRKGSYDASLKQMETKRVKPSWLPGGLQRRSQPVSF